ncbi:dihydroneopterin triphosphate 2'-epimerase [Mergibacter septicus]|uniref:Dihydroneopterin triphosphate 2'-epimerase n=1 Tax=Mergibacter septicus TaxID=221402 RepID=A0A8D4IYU7_9PAST|nr:dihydroneopterin triphosphate 2'-epimerase [Mergibacter septicus]AWX13087.1 dihydroneopterin triphosphate 2'-epimerase [Mergibacter septicus]AWX15969.1 dihydroneopterin triphosphate 2'-epimerase [Mergibacter septicus]QDJ12512.1 dihydroneopterin triphosphate 2'-epimerase [Mergibacter septicus]QDJ15222.1 dihydroneopterin triphosphate 2'-epimerase [Mergibacter septicus]UTU47358.1 dihydroneopterin triphosphate 2'-epimerase [Mergibacter septicus]
MPILQPAVIRIENLRLRTFIGIKEEEIQNKQDVVIQVKIGYNSSQAGNSDNVDDALNYRTITKKIIQHVENNQFALLERMVKEVLEIASEHSSVEWAEVEIAKPYALRYADAVSLTLSYKK